MYTPCVRIVLSVLLFNCLQQSIVVDAVAGDEADQQLTTISPHILATRSLRLPNETYPLSYKLHITSNIHLGDWSYTGNVSIDIEIRQSTNEIVLHAKNLSDIQITLRLLDKDNPDAFGELVENVTHTYDPRVTFLIIHPQLNYQAFEAGERYRLQILYTGVMRTKPKGLYWMSYKDKHTNNTFYVTATQAEPTYARLIFPCYDEPAFKSNYSIKLTHSSSYMAISNMPVEHLVNHGELTTTSFQTTPAMSTYLFAFVISNFEHISKTYRGVTQSVYSSPTIKDKGHSALNNSVRIVATLEDYFGVKYSLPKLDHVALKTNQGAAMENWGLITFKEECLLLHDRKDKHKHIKNTLTQNHEISHQWFGNLVSPEWWSYVWMNEGFATYFGYIITDMLYPNENIMGMFITDEASHAYSFSNFFDVRPVTHYVETESDIMNVFDLISYKRGACIIKMFHHAFDQQTFVRGISRYLKKFQYSVVNELDLFDQLQAELLETPQFQQQSWAQKVREIMLSWTHSEWLPIVNVIRNYENNTITFRQRSLHSKSEHWWIPFNFATAQSPSFERTQVEYFMPPLSQQTMSLEELHLELSGRDWLIVNKQQTGFYHVLYDVDNLMAIARQLQRNHTIIHAINRAALFQDLAPLIERNEIESINVVFELLKYLEFEENAMPWAQVTNTIDYFNSNLFGTVAHSLFKQFVRRLVTPSFLRIFGNNDTEVPTMDVLVHTDIMESACNVDVPECLEYTHRLAHQYIFKQMELETDATDYYGVHDVILCMGLRHLNDEGFDNVIDILFTIDRNSSHFDDIIYGLRCTRNHRHLLTYLELLLGENSTYYLMNQKESMLYLWYVYKSNLASRSVIWHFIERNYKHLCRSPHFVHLFNDIIEFLPEHQRPHFAMLRENIQKQLQLQQINPRDPLISKDSSRVGKKVRNIEQFLDKFEHRIHNWLLQELSTTDTQTAALQTLSIGVGNGSNRPSGVLDLATGLLKNALGLRNS